MAKDKFIFHYPFFRSLFQKKESNIAPIQYIQKSKYHPPFRQHPSNLIMFHATFKTSIALTIGLFVTTEASMPAFVPLACNANVDKVKCDTWTDRFGVRKSFADLVVVPCGECILLDRTISGSTLTFEDGIDVQGKLVFLEGTTINIRTPMIAVQGELQMYAAKKAVNGVPLIHILMTGQNDKQSYIAIGENSKKCSDDGTARCEVGKKSITVAGGKVNSKCHTSLFVLLILYFPFLIARFLILSDFSPRPTTKHSNVDKFIRHCIPERRRERASFCHCS